MFALAAPALALALLSGCAPLPVLTGRTVSTSLQDTADTALGRSIASLAQANAGLSGVVPLLGGLDAFAARIRLADAAERSLDVQSYIWERDLSGTLLLEALHRAADRGVRVRLLLDDHNTGELDETLAALDSHPRIEVRLFNPLTFRRWRPLGYVLDFGRLNRRMHNKSFTADNQATIIGGRNVGDAYFDAGQDRLFVDLDVLAVGRVVGEVSTDFDRYWASDSAHPADRLLPAAPEAAIAALATSAARIEQQALAVAYMQAIAESPFVRRLLTRSLGFEWTQVHLVSDDPAKGLGLASDDGLMWSRLKHVMAPPAREMKLVSPYFVPGVAGVELFRSMARAGVRVAVLTNALEATDVAAVHAGYAKRRKPLLEAGIQLFEMKRSPSPLPAGHETTWLGTVGSASSLHAKTFSVDGTHIFIGSFNFDPRSAGLNTEIGFVIESPALAGSITDTFAREMPARAYEVRLAEDGTLHWLEQVGGQVIVHNTEPGTAFWKRLAVWLVSLLPIEWLL